MNKKLKGIMNVSHWVIGLLVAVALVNWGTVFWFNFNIVEFITFGWRWLAGTVYTLVSVVGTIWLLAVLGLLSWRR